MTPDNEIQIVEIQDLSAATPIEIVEIQVPGIMGPMPELVIAQLMLGQADTENQVLFMGPSGSRSADNFETTNGLDLTKCLNVDTSETGTIKPAISAPVLIPQNEGTVIGNMNSNGGNAAAFNGATSQTTAQSAYSSGTAAFVGKIFDTARKIKRITIKGASDYGLDGTAGAGRITLTVNGIKADGTTVALGSPNSITDLPNVEVVIDSLDFTSDFVRVDIIMGSQLGGCCIAQVRLEGPGVISPMKAVSKVLSLDYVPTKMKSVILADLPVGADINTDLVMSFSRDGTTHLDQAVLTLKSSVSDTKHVFESNEVSLVGQPSLMLPHWQIDTFGLMIPVRAAYLYAIP